MSSFLWIYNVRILCSGLYLNRTNEKWLKEFSFRMSNMGCALRDIHWFLHWVVSGGAYIRFNCVLYCIVLLSFIGVKDGLPVFKTFRFVAKAGKHKRECSFRMEYWRWSGRNSRRCASSDAFAAGYTVIDCSIGELRDDQYFYLKTLFFYRTMISIRQ